MTHVRRPNRRPPSPEVRRLLSGETCPATSKIRYPDEYGAKLVIRSMQTSDPRGDVLETYRCDACGDWHVGHGVR